VRRRQPAGATHAAEVLRRRLEASTLAGLVEVYARLDDQNGRQLLAIPVD